MARKIFDTHVRRVCTESTMELDGARLHKGPKGGTTSLAKGSGRLAVAALIVVANMGIGAVLTPAAQAHEHGWLPYSCQFGGGDVSIGPYCEYDDSWTSHTVEGVVETLSPVEETLFPEPSPDPSPTPTTEPTKPGKGPKNK